MGSADAWHSILQSFDVVINCAGALQDTPLDDVLAVQETSICALVDACSATKVGLIQISAAGVSHDHPSKFFATKARADAAIKEHLQKYWIFRPGLVLSKTAYGGTTLLRMVAAFPFIQPIAEPTALIQTVSVDDIADAVAMVIAGKIPPGTEFDLLEDAPHTLAELIAAYRQMVGISTGRMVCFFYQIGLFTACHRAQIGLAIWGGDLHFAAPQLKYYEMVSLEMRRLGKNSRGKICGRWRKP